MTGSKILFIILSYLLGSIPFGLIITRYYAGFDIRTKGSGNIGFTNVLRAVGKKEAFLTLAGDTIKGFIPVILARIILNDNSLAAACGIAAIIGHDFPAFLRFKGGKGVATSFGALFGIIPLGGAIALIIWLVVFYLWKYSSLAAITSYLLLPLVVILINPYHTNIAFAVIVTALLLLKHIENIKRLLKGTENKIGSKK
jgi:glycerol-3-phosphate acyltransferase PlsY